MKSSTLSLPFQSPHGQQKCVKLYTFDTSINLLICHSIALGPANYKPQLIVKLRLFQKLKLLRNCEFNHLTIILTFSLTCRPKLPLSKWGPNK